MFRQSFEGQGLVEYAFILMLVALVVVVALTAVGTSVIDAFTPAAAAI